MLVPVVILILVLVDKEQWNDKYNSELRQSKYAMKIYKIASNAHDDILDALKRKLDPEIAQSLSDDLQKEIDGLGVNLRFENISALGIAHVDFCVIAKRVLDSNVSQILFVIFHELTHFHQYRKYGTDFVLSIYKNPDEELYNDAQKLFNIEQTANRMARAKSRYYLQKYNIEDKTNYSTYGSANAYSLFAHLRSIKHMIKEKNLKTTREINDYIYNSIKN